VDEDNLVKVTLKKVEPTALTGSVTLIASSGIHIWDNDTKGSPPISSPEPYSPSALPLDLYIEGYHRSTAVRDQYIRLEYVIGTQTFKDEIKLTVIDVEKVEVDSSDADSYKIDSNLSAAQVPDEHFVTVEGVSGDIALEATIVPDTAETKALIGWTDMTQDASDELKATTSRSASGKFEAKVTVDGKTAHSLTNWVVWSTCNTPTFSKTSTHLSGIGRRIEILVSNNFTFTIEPATFFTDADRPENLTGSPSPVPGAGQTQVFNGETLSGGADSRWDESRQVRVKILNPNLYTKPQLSPNPGHIHDSQPAATDIPEDYPSTPIALIDTIGNDDISTDDGPPGHGEDNDPYNIDIGQLKGLDEPAAVMFDSTGSDGDTIEYRYHFREFARLNLGSTWYRISDPVAWRTHFKFERVSGKWTDDNSAGAADNNDWE
jgi:hypothetical protein